MSRIDEATRRAGRADMMATAVVDEVLPQYAVEGSLDSGAQARTPYAHSRNSEVTSAAPKLAPWIAEKVVLSRKIKGVSAEQYRRLAAVLHSLQLERGTRTLMVSSAVPQEGKTLTITNLALTLSEAYDRRVLLIDADLRRPSVHDAFGLPNERGFVDVLRADTGPLPLSQLSRNLTVLTAGKMNASAPMAELTSDRFASLIKEVSAEFDWVLIDTPPAGLLPDAQLVARVADAVLLVIGAGSTPYGLVQRGIEALGDRVVGVVLNRVERRQMTESDYYRDYHTIHSDV